MCKPDDAETVEIPATTLRAKWFFEGDRHICNVVTVPQRSKYTISKPEINIICIKLHTVSRHLRVPSAKATFLLFRHLYVSVDTF